MPPLDKEIAEQAKQELSGLAGPARLVMFPQEFERQFCAEAHQLVEEVAEPSDQLTAEIYNFVIDKEKAEELKVDKIPAIAVIGAEDYGVRFYGIPSGYEFTSLLHAVQTVAAGETPLDQKTLEFLSRLEEPVHMRVFVTPTCPYCRGAVMLAHHFAIASPMVRADMVEATEFPHLSMKHGVMGVPRTDTEKEDQIYDLIILGGGPAGLTAATYAGRAGLKTLVLASSLPGGQVANTEMVENFPGFPEGIGGMELAQRMQRQAERFGAQIVMDSAVGVECSAQPFTVRTHSATYHSRTMIIATGAVPRLLGVPGEAEFFGRGVSTCATCDGFFFKDKRVVVVGGGDSAVDEGLVLTRFASEVIIVHRRDKLRATRIYQERAFANPKIRFVWDSVVEKILGDQTVTGVRIRNVKTEEESTIEADGVFIYIGMEPKTGLFAGKLELDEWGYIVSDRRQHTSVPGVFVAGDAQEPQYRQVVVAAGSGAIAAMEAEKFLGKYPDAAASTPA